jgi:hypothetical protein
LRRVRNSVTASSREKGVGLFKSSVQTSLVGALAAGSAFFLSPRFG